MQKMSRLGHLITLFSLLCWSCTAQSAANPPALATHQAFQMQHHLLSIMDDFHHYQSSQGDPLYYSSIEQHLRAFKAGLDRNLQTLPESEAKALNDRWKSTARALSSGLVALKQGGFLEQEVLYHYEEEMHGLWADLLRLSPSIAFTQPEPTQKWMALTLLMQQLALRYTNPSLALAGPYQSATLAQMATDFDSALTRVANQHAQDALKPIQEKWAVLQPALHNNSGKMGFIVTRYSNDIVALLITLVPEPKPERKRF